MAKITNTKLSHIVEIPKIEDEGFLCFAESQRSIPFPIKRIYYIFDVADNAVRGKHAHKQTVQMLFCIRGKIKIILDNGFEQEEVVLDKPNMGIYLGKMLWHEMVEFDKDTVLLVVASDFYDEDDYIRSYEEFKNRAKLRRQRSWQDWIVPMIGRRES